MTTVTRDIPAEAEIKITWKRSIVETDSDFYAKMKPVISIKPKVDDVMVRIATAGAVKELLWKTMDESKWSRKVGKTTIRAKRG